MRKDSPVLAVGAVCPRLAQQGTGDGQPSPPPPPHPHFRGEESHPTNYYSRGVKCPPPTHTRTQGVLQRDSKTATAGGAQVHRWGVRRSQRKGADLAPREVACNHLAVAGAFAHAKHLWLLLLFVVVIVVILLSIHPYAGCTWGQGVRCVGGGGGGAGTSTQHSTKAKSDYQLSTRKVMRAGCTPRAGGFRVVSPERHSMQARATRVAQIAEIVHTQMHDTPTEMHISWTPWHDRGEEDSASVWRVCEGA
jgi:hypothetical protein